MKTITLLSLVGVLASFQAANAAEAVTVGPYGQGNSVTYYKPASEKTTVAVYHHGRGVGSATRFEQTKEKTCWRTVTVGNSSTVYRTTESR